MGDILAANRFLPAIKEKYPDSKLNAFFNTEGNWNSVNILKEIFPHFYDSFYVCDKRKSQDFIINSQFGKEVYNAHLDNLQEKDLKELNNCDKLINLHIDSLKWITKDFDWLRYYYHFPKPTLKEIPNQFGEKYILCHFYARPNSPYNLEQWYITQLVETLSKFIKIVIITLPDHLDFYSKIKGLSNVILTTPNLIESFQLAQKCELFIGIDSGIRYIPYHYSKPVFIFSKYCQQYGQVAISHLIRWLIFEKNVFPMHFDIKNVETILKNCIENEASALFPQILENIDNYIVNRKYAST